MLLFNLTVNDSFYGHFNCKFMQLTIHCTVKWHKLFNCNGTFVYKCFSMNLHTKISLKLKRNTIKLYLKNKKIWFVSLLKANQSVKTNNGKSEGKTLIS